MEKPGKKIDIRFLKPQTEKKGLPPLPQTPTPLSNACLVRDLEGKK
jgi:hypothetical protein